MLMKFNLTAEMMGISDLKPAAKESWTDPSLVYYIQLHCERCGWRSSDFMRLCMEEPCSYEGKKVFHIIYECDACGRSGAIGIRGQLGVPLRCGVETTVMLLECEGLVPLDGHVDTGFKWTAVSEADGRVADPFDMVLGDDLKLEWQPMLAVGVHMEIDVVEAGVGARVDRFVATFTRV